jgi:hypothetical protein
MLGAASAPSLPSCLFAVAATVLGGRQRAWSLLGDGTGGWQSFELPDALLEAEGLRPASVERAARNGTSPVRPTVPGASRWVFSVAAVEFADQARLAS